VDNSKKRWPAAAARRRLATNREDFFMAKDFCTYAIKILRQE